uniref:Zinc finger protein 280D n=1 Tax=Astyanax mexicanus TaxID=7994 RepID=A0A3B1KHL0_ASTMX
MSELFMECEEEELEPWQRAVPEICLIDDDDDDEPIFVGEICSSKPTLNSRPNVSNPPNTAFQRPPTLTSPQKTVQMNTAKTFRGSSQSTCSPVLMPVSSPSGPLLTPRTLNTVSPQPIIINKQGYIVASPQNLNNNSTFINSLGSQYPAGTSFTVGKQVAVLVSPKPLAGVIHRPQVQLIQNNVVTLSNVQAPADIAAQSLSTSKMQMFQLAPQSRPSIMSPSKHIPAPTLQAVNNRGLRKCPKCNIYFNLVEPLKSHMRCCCPHLLDTMFPSTSKPDRAAAPTRMYDVERGKLIMLVSEFYYGKCEGDQSLSREQKSNTTFKCNSCLKTLKNNIRFMNHMKHHLELEKQNSESWESHTTCQHCYRQYSTPFQLQCHIESAHSPYESTTNCKICELAFETEQVLLEHMKDNHKPGEMPYGCQVCNYRSSFFSDVETHFRTVHENTKDLLCPFCLKVLRSGHMYMQHYMKHQKKGIQRCGKCRLNFLTYKEKVEHKTLYHRTFKKPRSLEGLPPGTKVTIRASLTGGSPMSPGSTPSKSFVNLVPRSPERPRPVTHKSSSNAGRVKINQAGKNRNPHNNELKGLRLTPGVHKCTECQSEVTDAYVHYPLTLRCSVCKYRTSCQKSFGQHMLRFHSSSSKQRLGRGKRTLRGVKSLTLVCLNCEFLANASNADRMCEHLLYRPNHTCQIILETGTYTLSPILLFTVPSVSLLPCESEIDINLSSFSLADEESSNETEPGESTVEDEGVEEAAEADAGDVEDAEDAGDAEAAEDGEDAEDALNAEASPNSLDSEADGGSVSVEDFLTKTDQVESVSVHSPLEPLTPSKVLECGDGENKLETGNKDNETDLEEEPTELDNNLQPSGLE